MGRHGNAPTFRTLLTGQEKPPAWHEIEVMGWFKNPSLENNLPKGHVPYNDGPLLISYECIFQLVTPINGLING